MLTAETSSPVPGRGRERGLVLATLNASGHLELYLTSSAARLRRDQTRRRRPDRVIAVDSVSARRKVAYRVESTRVAQMTNYDKLVLDVETDGSLTPAQALASRSTLKALFEQFASYDLSGPAHRHQPEEASLPPVATDPHDQRRRPRPHRGTHNCLKREGINTVSELIALSEDQLMNIRNFGSKSVDEVRDKLTSMAYVSRMPSQASTPHTSVRLDEDQI